MPAKPGWRNTAIDIQCNSEAEVEWLYDKVNCAPWEVLQPDRTEPGPAIQAERHKNCVVRIYSEEWFRPESVSGIIQEFLREFDAVGERLVCFAWCEQKTEMEPGGFGGGACIITRHGYRTFTTQEWIENQLDILSANSKE
jgi:hypothetical protein